jgi:hypothetical protein
MQLEFATMPPYLCAQWSIDSDPDGVGDLIQNIVVQIFFPAVLLNYSRWSCSHYLFRSWKSLCR